MNKIDLQKSMDQLKALEILLNTIENLGNLESPCNPEDYKMYSSALLLLIRNNEHFKLQLEGLIEEIFREQSEVLLKSTQCDVHKEPIQKITIPKNESFVETDPIEIRKWYNS